VWAFTSPLQTTFAIFVGGLLKGITNWWINRKNYSDAQKNRVENIGILVASGLIAGEALMGLVLAGLRGFNIFLTDYFFFFQNPTFIISLVVLALLALALIWWPTAVGKKEN